MNIHIPGFVLKCMSILTARGHSAHIVGGCVRDSLLGYTPNDWDICTSALPGQMQEAFGEIRALPTGLKHGTLTLVGEAMSIEATTLRRDGEYLNHRHPAAVDFTSSLEEDLARRDFTVNAMAYSPREGLIDPFGGYVDLKAETLRCVGDPLLRFEEDALRILRLFRFISKLGFNPCYKTLAGAAARKPLLSAISAERISAELNALIMGKNAHGALSLAAESGILEEIIPEFAPSIGFDQRSPYHNRTVDEHSFAALAASPLNHPVRLCLLLHDIAKPQTATFDKHGQGHYKGHAGVGAKISAQLLGRLKYPAKTAAHVEKLIAFHNKHIPLRPEILRRFLGENGTEFTLDLLDVKEADNRAKNERCEERIHHYDLVREHVEMILAAGDCLTLSELAVNGDDLAQAGVPYGPETGQALRALLEFVWKYPQKNTRAELLGQLWGGF